MLECQKNNENKCQSLWKHLLKYPGHNLIEGLKCLEYDRNVTPMQGNLLKGFDNWGSFFSKSLVEVPEQQFSLFKLKSIKEVTKKVSHSQKKFQILNKILSHSQCFKIPDLVH